MVRKAKKLNSSVPSAGAPIKLNRESFWIFNNGSADRFGIFRKEEQKKLDTEQLLKQGRIAYNYQRFNLEIEQTDWTIFYQQLVENLFREFDYIRVETDGRIMGVKNHHSRILSIHPDAYPLARKAGKALSDK